MLRVLIERTQGVGLPIKFKFDCDYPLVAAENWEESKFLLDQLQHRGFVDLDKFTGAWRVSANGFERLEETSRANPKNSDRAFVAMWFAPTRNAIYDDALCPAIEDAGYLPIRIDRIEHVNRIDEEIIAQLRQCRFLIADFTGQRGGVYFEAGFMLGLGRRVYWMCEKAHLNEVHFDTRQFNFIDYETAAEARRRLHNRIMAVEGRGPR